MKHLFRTYRIRFCVAVTALLTIGALGHINGDAPGPEQVRADVICDPSLRCDDTSWGG